MNTENIVYRRADSTVHKSILSLQDENQIDVGGALSASLPDHCS